MGAIAILTDVEISVAEFDAFILSIGGVKVNDTYQFEWRVSDDWKHLWIFLANDELHTDEAADQVTIAAKLNAQPQCQFVIEMSSEENVEVLAIDFIRKFSATWRCIIYNCLDAFVTVEELLAMDEEGADQFWNGMDTKSV